MQSCLRLEAAKTKTNVSTQFAYLCFYALLYRTNECCHSLCHVYTSVGVLLVVSLSICASIKWMLESWTFVCTVVLSDRCIRLYYMRLGTNFTYLSSNWGKLCGGHEKMTSSIASSRVRNSVLHTMSVSSRQDAHSHNHKIDTLKVHTWSSDTMTTWRTVNEPTHWRHINTTHTGACMYALKTFIGSEKSRKKLNGI